MFNFSGKYQFGTRLEHNGHFLEIVDKAKSLGVIITNDLKWDANTKSLVKRANSRMELLRKVASFGTSIEEKRNIYILFIRSILEQSSVVWHSSLTKENEEDLERVQKSALKIILGRKYLNYSQALKDTNLQSLKIRREELCLKFARKCLKSEKTKHMFPVRNSEHEMKKRDEEKFFVQHAKTERLRKSALPFMQRLLNNYKEEQWKQRLPG